MITANMAHLLAGRRCKGLPLLEPSQPLRGCSVLAPTTSARTPDKACLFDDLDASPGARGDRQRRSAASSRSCRETEPVGVTV